MANAADFGYTVEVRAEALERPLGRIRTVAGALMDAVASASSGVPMTSAERVREVVGRYVVILDPAGRVLLKTVELFDQETVSAARAEFQSLVVDYSPDELGRIVRARTGN